MDDQEDAHVEKIIECACQSETQRGAWVSAFKRARKYVLLQDQRKQEEVCEHFNVQSECLLCLQQQSVEDMFKDIPQETVAQSTTNDVKSKSLFDEPDNEVSFF